MGLKPSSDSGHAHLALSSTPACNPRDVSGGHRGRSTAGLNRTNIGTAFEALARRANFHTVKGLVHGRGTSPEP
jgi:hypothetical protein